VSPVPSRESPPNRFCGQCAAPLAFVCPSCGATNPPANKSCGQCAAPLEKPAQPRFAAPEAYTPQHLVESILTSKSAIEGERKQVTVLFADLKGSMELLARETRSDAGTDDGGRPPLRGHRQPGDGRRDHGPLRRALPGGGTVKRAVCDVPVTREGGMAEKGMFRQEGLCPPMIRTGSSASPSSGRPASPRPGARSAGIPGSACNGNPSPA
jgi:hypothetical protein